MRCAFDHTLRCTGCVHAILVQRQAHITMISSSAPLAWSRNFGQVRKRMNSDFRRGTVQEGDGSQILTHITISQIWCLQSSAIFVR